MSEGALLAADHTSRFEVTQSACWRFVQYQVD
jgi:hypothetical protein